MQVGTEGELANAFITLKKGVDKAAVPAPPAKPVELVHWCICLRPRVVGVRANQPLVIRNGEEAIHNIHAISRSNPELNHPMTRKGEERTIRFADPEAPIRFKCDVHPWEEAWVHVVEHPWFSVTGTDGAYSLKGLPAGDYEIEAWHEKFQGESRTARVTVFAGKATSIDFTFEASRR